MAPKADPKAKAKAPKVKKEVEDDTPKVVPPDPAIFQERIAKINSEIEGLQKEQAAITSKINEKTVGKEEYFQKIGELSAQINEIQSRIDTYMGQKEDVEKVVAGKNDEESSMRKEMTKMKRSMQFNSIEDIDDRINELEMKLQLGTMTLKAEKDILAEVKELKKSKPKVNQLKSMTDSLSKFDQSSEHKGHIKDINQLLYQCREERRAVQAKRSQLVEERQAQKGNLTSDFDEKKNISTKIQELINKRKEVKNEEYEANKEYNAYLAEQRAKRNERIAGEKAARNKAFEQTRREKMAEDLNQQPHIDEMTLIEQTLSWCNALTSTKEEKKEEVKVEVAHNVGAGEVVLASKKARDEEMYFEPLKKGKKGKGPKKVSEEKAATKAINHNAMTFKFFDELKIDAPLTVADIPKTIEILNAQYADYELKVEEWKEKREQRKKVILEKGFDPDAPNATDAPADGAAAAEEKTAE